MLKEPLNILLLKTWKKSLVTHIYNKGYEGQYNPDRLHQDTKHSNIIMILFMINIVTLLQ